MKSLKDNSGFKALLGDTLKNASQEQIPIQKVKIEPKTKQLEKSKKKENIPETVNNDLLNINVFTNIGIKTKLDLYILDNGISIRDFFGTAIDKVLAEQQRYTNLINDFEKPTIDNSKFFFQIANETKKELKRFNKIGRFSFTDVINFIAVNKEMF